MDWLTVTDTFSASSESSFKMPAIFSVSFLVFSASWRISSATTAKPRPASPALALSIDAFSASRFVWFDMAKIVSAIVRTALVRSRSSFMEAATPAFVSAIMADCFFRLFIIFRLSVFSCSDSFAACTIFCEYSSVWLIDCCMLCVISVCVWMLSAVLCVLSEIFFTEPSTIPADAFSSLTIAIAPSVPLRTSPATASTFSITSFCFSCS